MENNNWKKHCSGCIYFEEQPSEWGVMGECRRKSPQVVAVPATDEEIAQTAIWPMVNALDWCGEGNFQLSREEE